MPTPDETPTIHRARGGDHAALEALWVAHRGWIASVVRAHRPADVDAEDLVQEVAVRFVRGIAELGDAAAFGAWLRTIAVNVARSAGRRTRARPPSTSADVELPDTFGAARDADRERLDATLCAVDRLDPDLREALVLKSVHGFPQARIAATLGLTVTAVESRLARARRALREALASAEHDTRDAHRPLRRAR